MKTLSGWVKLIITAYRLFYSTTLSVSSKSKTHQELPLSIQL
jgi:hypothetical protein